MRTMNDEGARRVAGQADGVLLLGDSRLRRVCEPVDDVDSAAFRAQSARLGAMLSAFRARHGFGRAIAAPQLGIARRLVAANLDGRALVLVNPEIVWRSGETFTLWDDCMSFPDLLVRVRRHRRVSLRYTDGAGRERTLEDLDPATAELFQHELDHLDGVLAVDRAEGPDALVLRAVYEANRDAFARRVDGVGRAS